MRMRIFPGGSDNNNNSGHSSNSQQGYSWKYFIQVVLLTLVGSGICFAAFYAGPSSRLWHGEPSLSPGRSGILEAWKHALKYSLKDADPPTTKPLATVTVPDKNSWWPKRDYFDGAVFTEITSSSRGSYVLTVELLRAGPYEITVSNKEGKKQESRSVYVPAEQRRKIGMIGSSIDEYIRLTITANGEEETHLLGLGH